MKERKSVWVKKKVSVLHYERKKGMERRKRRTKKNVINVKERKKERKKEHKLIVKKVFIEFEIIKKGKEKKRQK